MLSGKVLKLSHNFPQGRRGGFQVDSPVKKPVASEMPRSAPPHTFRAGEEPLGGGASSEQPACARQRANALHQNPKASLVGISGLDDPIFHSTCDSDLLGEILLRLNH